jgi:hypothetical protein
VEQSGIMEIKIGKRCDIIAVPPTSVRMPPVEIYFQVDVLVAVL